ncbi:hypothetical protein [Halothiobacillus sp. DCM-1]|uniref:hypothetical protein n=1 Tax=Halothiobacillus sp. DCM-1 TaxID=3112558 RepID=UPI00324C29F2
MKLLIWFAIFFLLAMILIALAIVLGDAAPWYFAWIIGTGFLILTSAAAGVLFDKQEEESLKAR